MTASIQPHSMKTLKELKELTKKDLRDLFLKVTAHVKMKGVGYVEQAEMLGRTNPKMNEKRMKNIRKTGTPVVYPYPHEVLDLFQTFAKELADFTEEGPEPSELEKRVSQVEQEIEELKKKEAMRQQILSEIVNEIRTGKK